MKLLLAAGLLGTSLSLTSCATGQERWCNRVEDAAPGLARALDEGGAEKGLIDALPTLQDLADDAPDDVRAEWRTLVDAVEALDSAVEADDEKATQQAALKLASPDVQDAADAIEQQARDVCHTGLF